MTKETELISVIAINVLLILITLIFYHILFVRKGIVFPAFENGPTIEITNSFTILKNNIALIVQFEKNYFIDACGLDGYHYLFYIRQLAKLQGLFFVISILSAVFVPKSLGLIFIDQEFNPAFQMTMTIIYCGLILFSLYQQLEEIIKTEENSQDAQNDIIISHSIFLKGIREDIYPDNIKQFFQEQWNIDINVKVLQTKIIPNFPTKELKIQKENELYLQFKNQLIFRCCTPKQKEIPPTTLSSGHAIVTLNSIMAVQKCLEQFQLQFQFCNNEDITQQQISSLKLLAYEAPDPMDVVYLYLNTSVKNVILRRFIIQLLLIFVLLFFTTPTSLMQLIGFTTDLDSEKESSLFSQYVTLLIVVVLNSFLIQLIVWAARQERHISKSQYQISIFNRCVFYLSMNMLVIPAISFLAVNNTYQILIQGATNVMSAIQAIYFLNNGKFFIAIIIQAACVSLITMLRLDEIFINNISPMFANIMRKHYQQFAHLQPLSDIFTFGYYYGLQVTIIYIVMTFSTNIPFIHLAGLSYSCCRIYVDSLNLQTVFKQETKSRGSLIKTAIVATSYTIYPRLIINFVMFVLEWNTKFTIMTVGLVFVAVIAITQLKIRVDRFMNHNDYTDNRINLLKETDLDIYRYPNFN